jgi:hypothetical protein
MRLLQLTTMASNFIFKNGFKVIGMDVDVNK